MTKVTKAALPASLAAANASSTRPPIPRLMAATSGLMIAAAAELVQQLIIVIGADEINMRWLSSGLAALSARRDGRVRILLTNEGEIVEERRRQAVDGRRKDINKHSLNLVDGDKRPICKFRECYAYSLSVVKL